MKANQIAKNHKVHETLVSHIRSGNKFTDNILLAIDIAKLTGKKPITFIRPRLRELALQAHPELNKKVSA